MPNRPAGKSPQISPRKFDRRLVVLAFALLLLVFGGLFLRKYLSTTPPSSPAPAVSQAPRELREVILYFGSPDGTHLVPEGREIDDCLVEMDCVRETVQALLDGPVGDLVPILPSHAVLRGVTVGEHTTTIDFGAGLVSGHPGGTQSELLTVYGLADTLAANFPHLRQVRILVEGEAVDTLKGHIDLRQPISADFSLVEESVAVPEDMPARIPEAEE